MRLKSLTLLWVISNLLFSACNQEDLKAPMPVSTDSDLAREVYETGVILMDRLHWAPARDHLQQAIKEDPDFFMANFWLYYLSSKDAKKVAERILQTEADLNDAEKQIKTAFKYLLEGQDEKTVEYLLKAIELYPYDPQLYKILYMLQFQFMNDPASAVETIATAIEAIPEFPLAYNFMGYAQMDLGEFEKARKAFDQYIELAPDQANPYDSKGDYFMEMKQYEEAYESYMKAYENDSSFTISKKKAEKAKQMLEKENA